MARPATLAFALPAVIDLDALDTVRDRLIEALEAGPVTLVAAAVERVATNSLFMLLSAAETARRNDVDLAIEQPSPALAAAIERLGLGARFEELIKR